MKLARTSLLIFWLFSWNYFEISLRRSSNPLRCTTATSSYYTRVWHSRFSFPPCYIDRRQLSWRKGYRISNASTPFCKIHFWSSPKKPQPIALPSQQTNRFLDKSTRQLALFAGVYVCLCVPMCMWVYACVRGTRELLTERLRWRRCAGPISRNTDARRAARVILGGCAAGWGKSVERGIEVQRR